MPRTTTYTQFIALPAERVWAVIGDPVRWSEWNPAVTSVVLHGAPAVGARGDYLPRGRAYEAVHSRFAEPFTITAFDPERELVIEQPEPAGAMRIAWTLTPRDGGDGDFAAAHFHGGGGGAAGRGGLVAERYSGLLRAAGTGGRVGARR